MDYHNCHAQLQAARAGLNYLVCLECARENDHCFFCEKKVEKFWETNGYGAGTGQMIVIDSSVRTNVRIDYN